MLVIGCYQQVPFDPTVASSGYPFVGQLTLQKQPDDDADQAGGIISYRPGEYIAEIVRLPPSPTLYIHAGD